MKTLNEYVSLKNYNFDYIDNLIITEYNIDENKNRPIIRYGNYLYESLGIFNGCKEITTYILEQIKNNIDEPGIYVFMNKIKNVPKENQFFNSCAVFFNINDKYDNNEYAEYIPANLSDKNKDNINDYNINRWIEEEKKFSFIEINLYFSKKHINNIYSLIMHELIHAYDDYIHIKNSGFNYSLISRNYKLKTNKIDHHNENESDIEYICKEIIYSLWDHEKLAYIGQLNGEITGQYDNIKDVINELKKSPIYQRYKQLYSNYHIISKSKKYLNNFCDTYRSLENSNLSNDKIIKKLYLQFNKFWKKFINHIYQIAQEHIIIKESYITRDSRKKIIELKNV